MSWLVEGILAHRVDDGWRHRAVCIWHAPSNESSSNAFHMYFVCFYSAQQVVGIERRKPIFTSFHVVPAAFKQKNN